MRENGAPAVMRFLGPIRTLLRFRVTTFVTWRRGSGGREVARSVGFTRSVAENMEENTVDFKCDVGDKWS